MVLILFGMVLPWLLVAVGCWLGYQLVRQSGRILLRLEVLEAGLRDPRTGEEVAAGLPVGSVAPAFELLDLAGVRRSLAQYRRRKVLLIFFDPKCGFCLEMVPRIAALHPEGEDNHPLPLVVATGGVGANESWVREYRVRCPVLLQKDKEVAARYQADGTPTGYRVDECGAFPSPLARGAEALLALAEILTETHLSNGLRAPPERTGTGQDGQGPAAVGRHARPPRGKADRGLHTSKLNRSGLEAGTPAPFFRLPRVDGRELSLEEYRGRQVLLVFSDPQCGPCDLLAPQLEQIHRHRPDLQVIMVSRCDAEANRWKVQEQGLTFPVVLQRNWEVSLLYGMFATPIGYLIDEQGIILRDVAVGVEPILDLVSGPPVPLEGRGTARTD